MYNTYNRSDVYYLKDLYYNKTYLIGNKEDLIKFIARTISKRNNISTNLDSEFFYNLNMYDDLTYDGYSKRFLFFDGSGRIIWTRA